MSITATTALTSATLTTGQKTTATVTISNASASSVTILWTRPRIPTGAPVLAGISPAGTPGQTVTIAGGGTGTFSFDILALAPVSGVYASSPFPSGVTPMVGIAMPAQQVVAIGADCAVSDGSSCAATTTNLTINGPTR